MPANLLTATEAADKMARGELTSVDLVDACLARIAAREGDVHAFAHLDPEYARAQARAADALRAEGKGTGALHGVPVGVKDIIATSDMPTENGCKAFAGNQPEADAFCVAALRAAGAIILGKTVTTELATLTPPPTRNPRNTEHTPGGSSSGSAAAVADGMLPLALATQTGGSVIRPASFCGIYALKPSLGLISRRGVTLQSHTLDTVGVYGRSVADLALIADALSGHDPNDPVSYPRSRPNLARIAMSTPPTSPTFALVRTPEWADVTDRATEAALRALVSRLGDQCTVLDEPPLAGAVEAQRIVQSAENAHYYGPLMERHPDGLTDVLKDRLKAGLRISARSYLDALAAREAAYQIAEGICSKYDAILTLSAPGPAPKGFGSTGNPIFNGLWTFLGVPCVSLPLMEVDGLPVGIQIIGKRRDEGRLLRTARWLAETMTPGT